MSAPDFKDLSDEQIRELLEERDRLAMFYRACQKRKTDSPLAYADPEKDALKAEVVRLRGLVSSFMQVGELVVDEVTSPITCRHMMNPVLAVARKEGFQ